MHICVKLPGLHHHCCAISRRMRAAGFLARHKPGKTARPAKEQILMLAIAKGREGLPVTPNVNI